MVGCVDGTSRILKPESRTNQAFWVSIMIIPTECIKFAVCLRFWLYFDATLSSSGHPEESSPSGQMMSENLKVLARLLLVPSPS